MTDATQKPPLIGWMIFEELAEDYSFWDGHISYPDPTGANLAWENPIKMIEHKAYAALKAELEAVKAELEAVKAERDDARSVADAIEEQAKKNSDYDDWRVQKLTKERDALRVEAEALASVIQHALELGHLGNGSTKAWATDALTALHKRLDERGGDED